MDEERGASQVSSGARINTRERPDASDCPAWAGPASRDRWVQKGLIVWQEDTQEIFELSARLGPFVTVTGCEPTIDRSR